MEGSRKALTDDEYWGTNGSNTKSLYDLLGDKNIRAYPPDLIEEQKDDENHSSLDGGYTIKNYGTDGNIPGLIAIQIEVNDCMRKQYVRKFFAADLAECILNFVEQFL